MKPLALSLLALVAAGVASSSEATTITLTPTDIHGDDTNTASFTDGNLTLTPTIGAGPTTFNGNPARLGVDGVGTNNNAFNDPDTDPNNGNEEILTYEFATDVGLSQIAYDFSRADGPGAADGVVFTGLLSNPNVTFSVSDPNLFAVYDVGTQSVRLNIPGQLFGGALVEVNFAPSASAGQTLTMTTIDTTQAGAQLAIRSISYTVIPEPTTATIAGIALVVGLVRRRG